MNELSYPQDFARDASTAIAQLARFGRETDSDKPEYHGFLGSFTNATIFLLHGLINTSRHPKLGFGSTEQHRGQFLAATLMVNLAFHSQIMAVIEAMSEGFLAARNVTKSVSGHSIDRVSYAMKVARLPKKRRQFWRKKLDGIYVLRNMASHYDTSPASQKDILALRRAGLRDHLSGGNQIVTSPLRFERLAQLALELIHELEASRPLGVQTNQK